MDECEPLPGGVRLECEEHAGLFLSARRSPALDALLAGRGLHSFTLELNLSNSRTHS